MATPSTFLQDRGGFFGWNDLRAPASAINPPGGVDDPDFDATEGGYLFDPAKTEQLFVYLQFSHSYSEGTDIKPHLHYEAINANSGNVLWRLLYKWYNVDDVRPSSFTQIDVVDAVDGVADKHQIASFPDITGTGKKLSSMFVCKLQRVGGDALDTYGSDVRFLEFDLHYKENSIGSRQEFIK